MMTAEPNRFWEYFQQANWDSAFRALSSAISDNPRDAPSYANRGICLLAMRRLEEALDDFRKAYELLPNVQGCPVNVGVALWWLKRPLEAMTMWRKALDCTYMDAAGGVEVPALLYFGANRLNDLKLEQDAWIRMLRIWKPNLNGIWPGPIISFLLGRLDEQSFLLNQTFNDPVLEARRMCKAFFWTALKCYREGNQQAYLFRLSQAVQDQRPQHRANVLEPEYWLACAELELHKDTNG